MNEREEQISEEEPRPTRDAQANYGGKKQTNKKNWDLSCGDINPIIIQRLICAVLRRAAESAGRGGVNDVPRPGWGK